MAEKTYECACPVCHEATQVQAEFLSVAHYTFRVGEPRTAYPAIACRGRHTLGELRRALGMAVRDDEDSERVV